MNSRKRKIFPQETDTPARQGSPRWLAVAQRLQLVRKACDSFLDQWAATRLSTDSRAIDRVAADLAAGLAEIAGLSADSDAGLGNSVNSNWTALYRGSVLDD